MDGFTSDTLNNQMKLEWGIYHTSYINVSIMFNLKLRRNALVLGFLSLYHGWIPQLINSKPLIAKFSMINSNEVNDMRFMVNPEQHSEFP